MFKVLLSFLFLISTPSFSQAENEGVSHSETKYVEIEQSMFSEYLSGPLKSMILDFLKENPFSKMSKEDVQTMLDLKFQDQNLGQYLRENPKLENFLIDFIRDKKAIPSFFSIINKPQKMKKYGFCILAIFIFAFILNLKGGGNILRRLISKVFIFLGSITANIVAFYIIFNEEITPTIEIATKYI